jgi:O-antigen biosynthesis protein WbqV
MNYRPNLVRFGSIALDLMVVAFSFGAAYFIAYGVPYVYYVPNLGIRTGAFTAVAAISLFSFSVHRGSWRYFSIPELLSLIKASLAAVAVYTILAFLLSRADNVPRSVPILTVLFMIAGLSSTRLAYRLVVDGLGPQLLRGVRPRAGPGRNVLLCGISNEAEAFIRTIQRSRTSDIRVLGIVEYGKAEVSLSVRGVPIVGKLSDLPACVARFEASDIKLSEIVVTSPNLNRQQLGEILELANSVGLKVTRLPKVTDPTSVLSNLPSEPKPVELGDLLGRPEVVTDVERVGRLINRKVVLATGAGGSIGSELCRQIAAFAPRQLVVADNSEFLIYKLDTELRERFPDLPIVTRIVDVRDAASISRLFSEFRPEVVFHAAALKHVPLLEDNPLEAIKTNVLGTRNVADAALASGAGMFVMISTDKAVNPTNVMGATKRAAEAYCQSLDVTSDTTRFRTVRFGNVLGSNGSVVPRFAEQIAAGGPVTVTHPNIVRYFMTIPEAVRLVLHASAQTIGEQARRGKIMVLDMGNPVRIVDLAERMIQLAGFKPRVDIEIAFTGLRPGEKLYEELFDPSEAQDARTEDGFVVASPRVIDRGLLERALSGLESAVLQDDPQRALGYLAHIVPEYRRGDQAPSPSDRGSDDARKKT